MAEKRDEAWLAVVAAFSEALDESKHMRHLASNLAYANSPDIGLTLALVAIGDQLDAAGRLLAAIATDSSEPGSNK